jgi:hypothetical protein
MKSIRLIVRFIPKKDRNKIVIGAPTYSYSGKTKKECERKARAAYRWGAAYVKEWKTVIED